MTAIPGSGESSKPAWILLAIFFVSAFCMLIGLHGAPGIMADFILVFYLPGIVIMMAFDFGDSSREDHVFMPLVISPIAISLPLLALYHFTGSMAVSMKLAVGLYLAAFAALAIVRRNYSFGRTRVMPGQVYLISILFCLLLVVSFLVNRHLFVRSDAYYHVSLIFEIQERGMPPMDPRLPDIPLKYYWMYNFFLYGWKEISGIRVEWAMFSFLLVNAFTFPYLMARLTSIFTRDRARNAYTPLFAIAGLSAASAILWPIVLLRPFFGEVQGADEIRRILERVEFDSHRVVYTLTPYRTLLVNVLNKFYTLTSFTYSICMFLFATIVALDHRLRIRGMLRHMLLLTLIFTGTFMFQIITGTALLAMGAGSVVLLFAYRKLRERGNPPLRGVWSLPCAAVISAILVLPYVKSLGSVGEGNALLQFLHLGKANFYTSIAPLIVLLPFSYRALKKLVTTGKEEWRLAAFWILALFVVDLFFDSGGTSEIKLAFLLLQLLLPFVAWELIDSLKKARGGRRLLLGAWVCILFVVPSVLTVRGFLLDKPETAADEHRYHHDGREEELTDWIRENTDTYAVIMEDKIYNIMCVHAKRRNFYSTFAATTTFGYDDEKTERYREIYESVFSDDPIDRDDIEYLRRLDFDLYIVMWELDEKLHPGTVAKIEAGTEYFEKVFENGSGAVFRLIK